MNKVKLQDIKLIHRNPLQPNQKMGQRTKQTFLQRRHTDGQ